MIILGIDPGLARCGWALMEVNDDDPTARPEYVDSGVWQTPRHQGQSLWKRAQELYVLIDHAFWEWHKASTLPGRAAVEAALWTRGSSGETVSLARGVLAGCLMENTVRDVIDISPAEVKRRATGSGKAEKEEVRKQMEFLLGWKFRTIHYDESDAVAVGYAAWQQNIAGFNEALAK